MLITGMGSFSITSGKVFVCDPCYDISIATQYELNNIKNGTWNLSIVKKDIIKSMTVRHIESNYELNNFKYIFSSGVDSGQLGIFDIEIYPKIEDTGDINNKDSFYGKCCDITLSNVGAGIVDFKGVVSSSGYGDGCYEVAIAKNKNNEIIAIKVIFAEDNVY